MPSQEHCGQKSVLEQIRARSLTNDRRDPYIKPAQQHHLHEPSQNRLNTCRTTRKSSYALATTSASTYYNINQDNIVQSDVVSVKGLVEASTSEDCSLFGSSLGGAWLFCQPHPPTAIGRPIHQMSNASTYIQHIKRQTHGN